MVKRVERYKKGDRVLFDFLGEEFKGSIERVEKEKSEWGKEEVTYIISDGKYRYPLPMSSIKKKIK